MSSITTYIVDDEPLARQRMRHLLKDFPEIEITAEFGNGTDCIEAVLHEPPGLIFLDIGLPDHNGLEVVSELAAEMEQLPLIVFATAYDQHAIEAFELNALDYLLKPVSKDRIAVTVQRVRETLAAQTASIEDKKLRDWISSREKQDYINKIEIRDRGSTVFLPVKEIHFFQSDKNYIEVYHGGQVYLLRMTMARLEAQLDPQQFIRVSRSAIVPAARVKSIEKKRRNEFWINLDSGERVGASRNLDVLEEAIRNLP